jgi:hypothetical protein
LEGCALSYIPDRLHTNDRPEIPVFELGEFLFHRCPHEHVKEPFDNISLYDLSTNRQGRKDEPLCERDDVLFNLNPDNGKGERLNCYINTLEIKEISPNQTYQKSISHQGKDGDGKPVTHTCDIVLLHDRLPCNYSHSIMRITFNGTIVTQENYKNTLRRKGQYITELRTKCKLEFEKMILNEEVRITWDN